MITQQLLTVERSAEGVTILAGMPLTPEWSPRIETLGGARESAVHDVRDLVDAAGPLGLRDIAGGLDAPASTIAQVVAWMVGEGLLRQDEWGRYELAGAWRRW